LTCFVWINCFTSPDDTIEDRRPGKQHVSLNLNNGPSPPGQTRRPDREPRKIDLYRISTLRCAMRTCSSKRRRTALRARLDFRPCSRLDRAATATGAECYSSHASSRRLVETSTLHPLTLSKKTRSFHVQHTRDNTTVRFHNPRKSGAKYTCTLISLYISRVANPCTTR
jgi:hypothetical protein